MSNTINNQKLVIRTGKIEDAQALIEISNSVISEGKYFLTAPEEMEETNVEQQKDQIQEILNKERETLIVAEIDGVAIGSIVFRSPNKKRLAHTGTISMSIKDNYRGMGIGRLLLVALLDWAKKNPVIEKVNLGVLSTNHRAISLYKSLGFIEEGRKVKELKISDDNYIDDILMCKFV